MSFESHRRIPLSVPVLAGKEWDYLKECLDTNWVSSVGPFVDRFEAMMAERHGLPHAVAAVNGTAALHVALLVAGVRPDDEVVVSTLTFIAPANAIRYVGAWPLFVDADPETWQMDVDRVIAFLRHGCRMRGGALFNIASGRRIGALLPVHVLGHPVDMDPLLAVAAEFGLPVIEDATESLGATYKERPVGALGDMAALSFNGNKLITCGGGGMILARRADWAKQAKHLTTQARSDAAEYIHDAVGFNYRLTNVQAALGVAQAERLEPLIAARRRIADRYREACRTLPGLSFMPEAAWARSIFWLSTLRIDPARYGRDARALMKTLARRGIESRPLWQPLHRSPAHAGAAALGGETAERLYAQCLSLPSSSDLSEDDQARVIAALGVPD